MPKQIEIGHPHSVVAMIGLLTAIDLKIFKDHQAMFSDFAELLEVLERQQLGVTSTMLYGGSLCLLMSVAVTLTARMKSVKILLVRLPETPTLQLTLHPHTITIHFLLVSVTSGGSTTYYRRSSGSWVEVNNIVFVKGDTGEKGDKGDTTASA